MSFKTNRSNVEIAAEWLAASCIGGAVAFAILTLAPGGFVMGCVSGVIVAGLALIALSKIDREQEKSAGFELVDFPNEESIDEDVLLLDEPCGLPELLLDQPLSAPVEESRVVRLFTAGPDACDQASAIPAPGEMLARIENFLGTTRAPATPIALPRPAAHSSNSASVEASAALHAALADIRRSLRQG